MVNAQINLNDDLLRDAFRRFDKDSSGYITTQNLKDVLGHQPGGEKLEAFIGEADANNDGQLCFEEFSAYLKGNLLGTDGDVYDTEISADSSIVADEGSIDRTLPTASKP